MVLADVSEELVDLYDFFDKAPVALAIIGRNGRIRLANEAAVELVGEDEDLTKLVGREVGTFLVAPLDELFAEPTEPEGQVSRQALVRDRDGRSVPVVLSTNTGGDVGGPLARLAMVPLSGSARSSASTSRSSSSDRLASMSGVNRKRYLEVISDFFENAPVALHIVGPDGRIVRANRLELESMGYSDDPGGYLGHHIAEFHADQVVIDDMLDRLVGGRPLVDYRATLLRRDGEKLDVMIYSSPRIEDGRFINTRCFTFPRMRELDPPVRRFDWPRNDGVNEAADTPDPLTLALRRLAGRKAAEASLGFLAALSSDLESTSSDAEAAEVVSALAVPFLADWCSVFIAQDGGPKMLAAVRNGAVSGSDELLMKLLDQTDGPGAERTIRQGYETREAVRGEIVLTRGASREPFGAADRALIEELARRLAVAIAWAHLRSRVAPVPS